MIENTRVLPVAFAYTFIGIVLIMGLGHVVMLLARIPYPIHYNFYAALFVIFSALLINPALMLAGTKKSSFKLAAIYWMLLTFGVMFLFFADINGPFTPLWSILILLAALYDGWRGFFASSAFFVISCALYLLLFVNHIEGDVVTYSLRALMTAVFTLIASYFFVQVMMISRKKTHDLEIISKSESIQVNRLNTLLNSITDAVITLNRYGRVTSQNASAQAFFDTNRSLIGTEIDTILSLQDEDQQAASVHDLIANVKTSSVHEDYSIEIGGELRRLSIRLSRIHGTYGDEEDYGVVVILRDITKQKALEDAKDEFISVTSHELRTPVTIAEGSLSNLIVMQGRDDVPEDKLHKAVEDAHKQIVYLAKMINDLSTLSRAERGVSDVVEEIDINEMLTNLYSRYQPEAEEKSLQLDLEVEPGLGKIKTSRLYLEEILQNFITNSIKYTKQGSVTLGAKKDTESNVEFYVRDTGIGMSKTDQKHIFEKFYRSEDYRTRETGGTGLGLYVVHQLADKISTQIEVESRLNVGSTFKMSVPREVKNIE